MKSLLLLSLVALGTFISPLLLTSCASRSSSVGDGTYTAPPAMSPVDATDRMRSEYRGWIR